MSIYKLKNISQGTDGIPGRDGDTGVPGLRGLPGQKVKCKAIKIKFQNI